MRAALLTCASAVMAIGFAYTGCAASGDDETESSSSSTSNGGNGGSGASSGVGGSGTGGLDECARFTESAEQQPAAMLTVLDASASMGDLGKWQAAQLAVVTAIDKDVFDTMSLGLLTFPSTYAPPPECLCTALTLPYPCTSTFQLVYNVAGVTCGYSALPQIALAPAGMDKSNASLGVRSDMYGFLAAALPFAGAAGDDGSPVYEGLSSGYAALKAYSAVNRRILVLITDGGFSCTSLSNRTGIVDANGCQDWEHPDSVNTLIQQNRDDPNAPVNTFVVGVPGSDSNGQKVGAYDTPPYSMQLALSTYAVTGSPNTVDAACDSSAVFTENGPAPTTPCHIDLSSGQFDANALADAITAIRGKALGCLYELPTPPPGETIDLNQVNVTVTLEGTTSTLPKRSDPNDDCATDGCWDYTANNEVQILGKTCDDISVATQASVDIVVGCATILK